MARRLRGHVRCRVPRRAAGMPDPDDAAQPALLRAGRRRRQARQPLPRSSATSRPRDPSRDRRRQRAGAARAARRCQVLLRPGPQACGSRRALPKLASIVYHNKLGTQARTRRAAALARAAHRAADRRRPGARGRARRARQGRSRHRHGRRVSRAAGPHGPLLREHDGEPADGRRGDRAALLAARSPATRCRKSPVAQAVALADKLEALAGMFGIGQVPTGDKDPFGLAPRSARRRAHPRRAQARACRCRSSSALAFCVVRCRAGQSRRTGAPCSTSSTSACAATCATRAIRRTRSRPCSTRARTRSPTLPSRLAAVQAFAALPEAAALVRGEQAHRQHPAQERQRSGARGRPRAPRRRRRARPLPHVPAPRAAGRRRLRRAAISPARCARSRPPSPRSTATSTT